MEKRKGMTRPHYRILNTLTKKYERWEGDGGILILAYYSQAEAYIDRKLKGSRIYKIVTWHKQSLDKNGIPR